MLFYASLRDYEAGEKARLERQGVALADAGAPGGAEESRMPPPRSGDFGCGANGGVEVAGEEAAIEAAVAEAERECARLRAEKAAATDAKLFLEWEERWWQPGGAASPSMLGALHTLLVSDPSPNPNP